MPDFRQSVCQPPAISPFALAVLLPCTSYTPWRLRSWKDGGFTFGAPCRAAGRGFIARPDGAGISGRTLERRRRRDDRDLATKRRSSGHRARRAFPTRCEILRSRKPDRRRTGVGVRKSCPARCPPTATSPFRPIATCGECLAEVLDPSNRRYGIPSPTARTAAPLYDTPPVSPTTGRTAWRR